MDTGLIEYVTPDAERTAGRMPPAVPFRHAPAPAAARDPDRFTALSPGMAPIARGLAALAPFGYDTLRRKRFLAAHEHGCCYQCHAPFQNLLNDCPCPHWFITSASSVERVAPVFRMYAVADVLHFIFLCLMTENAMRAPSRHLLTATVNDGIPAVAVRLARKQWRFTVAPRTQVLTVSLFNPRTGKTAALDMPATERDIDIVLAVAEAIAHH